MNKRIWELDALRGVGIWAVVVLHLMYDLQLPVLQTLALRIIMTVGGLLFVILSGLCVTLGSHSVRRGAVLLGWGGVGIFMSIKDGQGMSMDNNVGKALGGAGAIAMAAFFRRIPLDGIDTFGNN